jgi:hypothetical protein
MIQCKTKRPCPLRTVAEPAARVPGATGRVARQPADEAAAEEAAAEEAVAGEPREGPEEARGAEQPVALAPAVRAAPGECATLVPTQKEHAPADESSCTTGPDAMLRPCAPDLRSMRV